MSCEDVPAKQAGDRPLSQQTHGLPLPESNTPLQQLVYSVSGYFCL